MLGPEDLRDAPQFERRLRWYGDGDGAVKSSCGHAGRIVLDRVITATFADGAAPRIVGGMSDAHPWAGEWRNQYGSTLTITDDAGNRIRGTFRTALDDSAFAGEAVEITGMHVGACVQFAFGRSGPTGEAIASFTGLLRAGRLETLWHVVSDSAVKPPGPGRPPELIKLPWAHAALTNADTFQRVRGRD